MISCGIPSFRDAATGTELSRPTEPNALWCADYQGEFMLGNRRDAEALG